jgi:hypothetical protein
MTQQKNIEWNKNRGKNSWQNHAKFNTPGLPPIFLKQAGIVPPY